MNRIGWLLVLALIACLGRPSVAQEIEWSIYKPTNTGLPGNYVYDIAVDPDGTVWTTSDDPVWDEGGLGHFDGGVWESWTNVDGGAPTHYMHGLQFDALGNAWLASNVGLLRFDGEEFSVVWSMVNAPWPTNKVSDFDWDSNGNLWVALDDVQTTNGGLAKYDGTTWTVYTTANGLPWNDGWDNVSAVEVDSEDRVFFGSPVKGAAVYDGTTWDWIGVAGTGVTDIAIASNGDAWFVFSNWGVWSWNGQQWVDRTGPFGSYGVSGVTLDRDDFIWATTYTGFIARFNGTGWDAVQAVPGLSHVYALGFDAENEPWVGGIGGLLHHEGGGVWMRYSVANTGLPSRWIDAAFVDSEGTAWFGTGGGGLSSFDGTEWANFSPHTSLPWPFPTDSAVETVEDAQGHIWTTPRNNGVGRWDGSQWEAHLAGMDIRSLAIHPSGDILAAPHNGQLRRWNGSQWSNMGNPSSYINAVTADPSGTVWLATIIGLMRYDGEGWTEYTTANSDLPENYTRALAVDADGSLWIGTASGLAHYDGTDWTVYDESNSGVAADNISSLAIAADGALWVGAFNIDTWPYYGGVARFDGNDWSTYTQQNSPLPHEQVEALAADAAGGVWVATASEGLAFIQPQNPTSDEPGSPALDVPGGFALSPAYPNPFSDRTAVTVRVERAQHVRVEVFDLLGRRVAVLHDGQLEAGAEHLIELESANLPDGAYFIRGTGEDTTVARRATLIR